MWSSFFFFYFYSGLFVCFFSLPVCLFSKKERKKGFRVQWMGIWGRPGGSSGKESHNQNILYEEVIFNKIFKEKINSLYFNESCSSKKNTNLYRYSNSLTNLSLPKDSYWFHHFFNFFFSILHIAYSVVDRYMHKEEKKDIRLPWERENLLSIFYLGKNFSKYTTLLIIILQKLAELHEVVCQQAPCCADNSFFFKSIIYCCFNWYIP